MRKIYELEGKEMTIQQIETMKKRMEALESDDHIDLKTNVEKTGSGYKREITQYLIYETENGTFVLSEENQTVHYNNNFEFTDYTYYDDMEYLFEAEACKQTLEQVVEEQITTIEESLEDYFEGDPIHTMLLEELARAKRIQKKYL